MIFYPAICHFEDGGYWCEFPDLKGCFTQGDTENELMENAKEALSCHIENFLEKGENLPKPSKITDLKLKEKDFATFVECDISAIGKYIRKNVTLPEWLSHRAEKQGVNFSQVLQEALIKKLGITE